MRQGQSDAIGSTPLAAVGRVTAMIPFGLGKRSTLAGALGVAGAEMG